MNSLTSYTLTTLLALFLLSGCLGPQQDTPTGQITFPDDDKEIVIGAILPLTGPIPGIGQGNREAMELAVEEINTAGGINGAKLKIIFEDGKCDAKEAVKAANKLINVDGVPVIIGGFCSSETLGVAPLAEEAQTVLLSPASSSPDITQAGDYIFRVYPSDSFQGKYAAQYVYTNLGKKRAAVLNCLADYCTGIKEVFKKEFAKLGGSLVGEESFIQGATDLRSQLAKIREARPDVVYFLGYTDATVAGIRQAREFGIEALFFGGDSWGDPKIWSTLATSGNGAMYTTPATPDAPDFAERMQSFTGKEDVAPAAANSYDAVNLIANAMKKSDAEPENIKDALYIVRDYPGVSGTITIDPNGDLVSAEYAVKVVEE